MMNSSMLYSQSLQVSDFHCHILPLCFCRGREYTQKEVADTLGISQSYISRLEKKIMQRLKREMVRYEQ